ncbi:MAG: hypothetical protein ABII82_01035, partial [Verrucomicrobiota bacterium]
MVAVQHNLDVRRLNPHSYADVQAWANVLLHPEVVPYLDAQFQSFAGLLALVDHMRADRIVAVLAGPGLDAVATGFGWIYPD